MVGFLPHDVSLHNSFFNERKHTRCCGLGAWITISAFRKETTRRKQYNPVLKSYEDNSRKCFSNFSSFLFPKVRVAPNVTEHELKNHGLKDDSQGSTTCNFGAKVRARIVREGTSCRDY